MMNLHVLRALAVVLAFAALYQPKARAEGYELREVLVHTISYHTDRDAGYNEVNTGIGLIGQRPGDRSFIVGGFYHNSIRRETVYAGAGYDLLTAGPFYFRAEAVLATGYTIAVVPALIPEIGIRVHGWGMAVHYLPSIEVGDVKTGEVFALSLTRRW